MHVQGAKEQGRLPVRPRTCSGRGTRSWLGCAMVEADIDRAMSDTGATADEDDQSGQQTGTGVVAVVGRGRGHEPGDLHHQRSFVVVAGRLQRGPAVAEARGRPGAGAGVLADLG
jgi:hypothetical protein